MRPGADTTLSILAGGKGLRLGGVAKGLLRWEGRTVLEHLLELAPLCADVLLVTEDVASYASFGVRAVADLVPGKGAPGGVHAALVAARTPWVLAVACDMPFIRPAAVRLILDARTDAVDVVCFEVAGRLEPLLAAYRTSLSTVFGEALQSGPSLRGLIAGSRTKVLPEAVLRAVDPQGQSVQSINAPEDLRQHRIALPDVH